MIATGTGFYLFKFKKPSQKDKLQNSLINIAKMADEIDSDKDGLKDWEEVLWKTDINKPDSDGDGYSDKQEIDTDYDPNDQFSNEKTGKKNQIEFTERVSSDSENLTQDISKNIAYQIESSATNNGDMPNFANPLSLIDQNTNKGMAEFMASLNVGISDKEFKTSSDNSPEAVQKYADSMMAVFPKSSFLNGLAEEFLKAVQYRDYKKIDEFVQGYVQITAGLKNIVVPSDFSRIHKRFIELFAAESKIFESVKNFETDPLKALIAIEQEEKNINELTKLFNDFFGAIKEHGIKI